MIDVRVIAIADTKLDLLEERQLVQIVAQTLMGKSRPLVLASSNLDHVHHFGRGAALPDPSTSSAVADWLVTADGRPIVWAARWLTGRRWPQLAGSDLLPGLLEVASHENASVGFLGGRPKQHALLATVLPARFPGLEVRGYWAPSRADLMDAERARNLAHEVAAARVDLLVVGLGKPRQELWLAEHVGETGARVALAFGGAADFLAGTSLRAPRAWRRAGMEWLYRLLHEPGRLWRRYLLQGPVALWRIIRWSRSHR